MSWTRMVSMENTDEERYDTPTPIAVPDKPKYPYGLRICLTQNELSKLGLDPDCCIGDQIDLRAFAEVTSISIDEGDHGQNCRIELQIQQLSLENENTEETPS